MPLQDCILPATYNTGIVRGPHGFISTNTDPCQLHVCSVRQPTIGPNWGMPLRSLIIVGNWHWGLQQWHGVHFSVESKFHLTNADRGILPHKKRFQILLEIIQYWSRSPSPTRKTSHVSILRSEIQLSCYQKLFIFVALTQNWIGVFSPLMAIYDVWEEKEKCKQINLAIPYSFLIVIWLFKVSQYTELHFKVSLVIKIENGKQSDWCFWQQSYWVTANFRVITTSVISLYGWD